MNIRPYKHSDYETICSWWTTHGEPGPVLGMMIEDGTFVAELCDEPALSLTVFLTQSKELAYLEGYVKNPKFKNLEAEGKQLFEHCYDFAKSKGYKRVVMFSQVPKLNEKCIRYGMLKAASHLSSTVKELE